MKSLKASQIGRSVLGLIAVTLMSALSLQSAQATITEKWSYEIFNGMFESVRSDGEGGIVTLAYNELGEKSLIWFNPQGQILANVPVAVNANVAFACKKHVFVNQDNPDPANYTQVTIVYRNGTTDSFPENLITDWWPINSSQDGNPLTDEGFAHMEFIDTDGGEDGPWLARLVFKTVKKN